MDLDWRRFILVVDGTNQILACGQIKPHGKEVMELASIAVRPDYRGQGLARRVIEHLLVAGPRPLYLTCRSPLGAFYEKWGFQAIGLDEMPVYFRRLSRLVSLLPEFARRGETLLVMKLM